MSHGRPPLEDVFLSYQKIKPVFQIQQVQKSKQPLDKMDADKKLARFFYSTSRDAHGSNRTGSVHWRFGSVRFVSEPGEPSTHG
ncbi:unnamed protein product [Rhizophagus irregularis]|nr:unnamed protein product [Rhizophagus irregularis]